MDGLSNVLGSILCAVAAHALDDAALEKLQLVGVNELAWLNLHVAVMIAADLGLCRVLRLFCHNLIPGIGGLSNGTGFPL